MTTRQTSRPLRRAALAVAVAAMTSLATVPAAWADPGDPYSVGGVNQENTANKALINPNATVQLSIHKYLGAPTGKAGDGTQQVVTGLPALNGVNFDVYQVFLDAGLTQPVDLTTNDGWQTASSLNGYVPTPAQIAAGSFTVNGTTYYLGTAATVTTANGGTANFTKTNGVGLYLVNENLPKSGGVTNASTGAPVDKATITPASPFLVTLPMTNPGDTTRWMYDVAVYPKNQQDTATKQVSDAGTTTQEGLKTGDHDVDYTIRTSITDGLTGTQMGRYTVTDVLDSRLTYGSAAVFIDPDGDPATSNRQPLTVGTDYTVTPTTNPDGTTTVTVNFTTAGLDKLAAANSAKAGALAVTVINATVSAEGTNGLIANQASVIPNQAWADAHPGSSGETTNTTESHYGDVLITKVDPQTASANMAGAEFSIYRDYNFDSKCDAIDLGKDAISGAMTAGVVSGTDEKPPYTARFTGLQASNFYDGQEQTNLHGYCLVETKAPVGYNLDATPRYVTIDYKSGTTTAPALATMTVSNEKSNLNNSLPLTGGGGIALISGLGALLVGGGAAYYVAASRRRDTHRA